MGSEPNFQQPSTSVFPPPNADVSFDNRGGGQSGGGQSAIMQDGNGRWVDRATGMPVEVSAAPPNQGDNVAGVRAGEGGQMEQGMLPRRDVIRRPAGGGQIADGQAAGGQPAQGNQLNAPRTDKDPAQYASMMNKMMPINAPWNADVQAGMGMAGDIWNEQLQKQDEIVENANKRMGMMPPSVGRDGLQIEDVMPAGSGRGGGGQSTTGGKPDMISQIRKNQEYQKHNQAIEGLRQQFESMTPQERVQNAGSFQRQMDKWQQSYGDQGRNTREQVDLFNQIREATGAGALTNPQAPTFGTQRQGTFQGTDARQAQQQPSLQNLSEQAQGQQTGTNRELLQNQNRQTAQAALDTRRQATAGMSESDANKWRNSQPRPSYKDVDAGTMFAQPPRNQNRQSQGAFTPSQYNPSVASQANNPTTANRYRTPSLGNRPGLKTLNNRVKARTSLPQLYRN